MTSSDFYNTRTYKVCQSTTERVVCHMVVCQESDLLFFQSSRKKTPEDTNSTGYTGNISEPDMLRWRTDFAEHESIGFAGIIHVEINTGLLRDITSLLVRSRNKP